MNNKGSQSNSITGGQQPGAAAADITRQLAEYATRSRFDALPDIVVAETVRAFVNWLGCVLGGCREPSVQIAAAVSAEAGSRPQASVIGHGLRTDVVSAAFVNCMSSSALAFDDTHLATVTHPTGPVAAVILALAECQAVSGSEFVNGLAVGIEIQCRMSNVLLLPPAQSNLGFYLTGLTGPIGAAAAAGRLLGLEEEKMAWALGLAATQSSGFRATHGTMAGALVPALAARGGLHAVMLARRGFTCSGNALEAEKGFVDVYAQSADRNNAVEGLGQHFELLANTYKPYPCGIVIHAAIDACLHIAARLGPNDRIETLSLRVHPLALALTDRREPRTAMEAQVSLYHWAAAALLRRAAGLSEMRQDCIDDTTVAALRRQIIATADPTLGRDEAIAEVRLMDQTALDAHVKNARGSRGHPMTDQELDEKFRMQARLILSEDAADSLLQRCRHLTDMHDVGRDFADVLKQ